MTSTVLITGASQGIGLSTAKLFASKGYNVVLAARTLEKLQSVAQEIEALGVKALPISCDVTNLEQVNSLIEKALTEFGEIDVLINNAGICMTAPMEKTTLEDWQHILNVNLWGYIYPIHALLPHFLERKQGTIVNVGSFGGKMPLPNMTAYCTSKYAVTGLTETLRIELASKGIQVSGVHPSVTNSNFLERAVFHFENKIEEDSRRQQMKEMLKGPLVSQPEDVAKAIWSVVQHPSPSIIVGSGGIATGIYSWFPSLVQWVMQKGSKG